MMATRPRYTAAELARLGGVFERTVRYYVQEGLISSPLGRGRGAHFDDRHLAELRSVKQLQASGLDLAAIRRHREDLAAVLKSRGFDPERASDTWTSFASQVSIIAAGQGAGREPAVSALSAIHVAPGLDLMVGTPHRMPPPARLTELVRLIRVMFGLPAEPGSDEEAA